MRQIDEAKTVLVLVNLGDIVNGDMTSSRAIETMWLTKAILDHAAGNHRCAIVLTQADSYRAVIEGCGGPAETVAKYLPHVANNYPDLPVFAVAAVDEVQPDGSGLPVPARGYGSEGIGELLAFMVGEGFRDTETSVRKTVKTIRTHPLIPKDVTVRGFIIDSVTGELQEIV